MGDRARMVGGVSLLLWGLVVAEALAQAPGVPDATPKPEVGEDGQVMPPGNEKMGAKPGDPTEPPGAMPDLTPPPDRRGQLPAGREGEEAVVAPAAVTPAPPPAADATPVPDVVLPRKTTEKTGQEAFTPPAVQAGAPDKAARAAGAPGGAPMASTTGTWVGWLALAGLSLVLYAAFWRPLMGRLDALQALLEQAVRPLADGTLPGVRRIGAHRAHALLAADADAPLWPLPPDGLAFASCAAEALPAVGASLAAAALRRTTVLVVTPRDPDTVAREVLAALSPAEAPPLAERLLIAQGGGASVNTLARWARRLLPPGDGVVLLESPSWLVDLDAPSRSAWALAGLTRRLRELAFGLGAPVWVLTPEGPLAATSDEARSEQVAAVFHLTPVEGGLSRVGHLRGNPHEDTWRPAPT